jgi:hypothetical protein
MELSTKNLNYLSNDGLYLTMRDWYGHSFASVQKWFYELMFYKKSLFTITTDEIHGDEQELYDFRRVNKFNCGPRRKRRLLMFYGNIPVRITFLNGKTEYLPVSHILTIYGWKYLLFNVQDIVSEQTGEVLFCIK